jgi:hypothetical protein
MAAATAARMGSSTTSNSSSQVRKVLKSERDLEV